MSVINNEAHVNIEGREVIFPVNETIIHKTLRTEDLVDAFESWLEATDPTGYKHALARKADYYTEEDGSVYLDEWLNESLFDIMCNYAPEGFYFGALEGDASDFGFWEEIWLMGGHDGCSD